MTKFLFASLASITSLFAAPVLADNLQVNITYSEKAEKAFVETYGERERETVRELIEENLNKSLGSQAARVDVIVNKVVANRPTFKEMGDRPSLSLQSFGIGGADVSGKAYDAAGNLLGQVSYDWYGDIHWADSAWTWTDANRALYQFSRRLADAVPG